MAIDHIPGVNLKLLILTASMILCSSAADAGTGAQRASRFIADTHPVFDCRSEEYGTAGMVCDWDGATGTNDAVALQACIDAAAAASKYSVAYIGQCRFFTGTTSIEINETVTLAGCGSGSAWGRSDAEADDACTLWVIDDAMAHPALYIRGDGAKNKGFEGWTRDWGSEGIRVEGIKFISETAEHADTAIKLDGTYADEEVCNEPGKCKVDGCATARGAGRDCRGAVRSVTISDVGCYKLGGACILMAGNVFDITLFGVNDFRSGKGGITMLDLAGRTCNNDACHPAQVRVYESVLSGCDRDAPYCIGFADACAGVNDPYVGCTAPAVGHRLEPWALTGGFVTLFGGNIEGDFGLSLGPNAGFYGTHFEGNELSAGSIGLEVAGQNVFGSTDSIKSYENCVKIGEDGAANRADGYFIHIGKLNNCNTVGLHIEDGATRSGVVNIGSFGVNGTDVIDDRTANAGEIIKQLLGVDSDDSFAVPVDDMKFGDGTDSDQQIVFNEGDAGNADPRLRFVNAQDLFQLTLDVMIGPDTGDATLTFDGGDTDSTLNWNEIDDIFEFDQPLQIGGAIPAISAPAGNDLEINVEDGQLVKLDTFTLEACSTVRAARTVTIDDCNVAALNGSADIRALESCDAATAHRVLHLICGAYTGVVTDGNNLKMAGDLDCGASSPATTLVLLCDGANWLELSRSVN